MQSTMPIAPDSPGGLGIMGQREGRLLDGRFRLIEPLGQGGMGSVWLAEQLAPVKRQVAVKLIRLGADTQQGLIRFEAERQALALMDHPNIATVLDGGMADGDPYCVMELVRGSPMTMYCEDKQLPLRQRLALFLVVCHAVQHAHQKGVIHRDLKPTNILVSERDGKPQPKVIDFGLAKAAAGKLTDRTLLTEAGQLLGTLEYMAPEQAGANPLDVDTRADIYALGVILYELLTGQLPFSRLDLPHADLGEILRVIREVEPPTPSKKLSQIRKAQANEGPPAPALRIRNLNELDWIVMKCLEKDRARRYETAAALAEDLERYLRDEPIAASPPDPIYRLRKFLRRHRGPALAAALVFIALVAGIAATTLALFRAWEAEKRQRDLVTTLKASEAAAHQLSQEAQAAEKTARNAQMQTRQVLYFFNRHIIASARPKGVPGGMGKDVLLRTAVDHAEKQIAVQFRKDPEVEVLVRTELGRNYLILGDQPAALRQLERALTLARANLAPDSDAAIHAKDSMGALLIEQMQAAKAEPYVREVLEARRKAWPANHEMVVTPQSNLAMILIAADRLDQAEALIEETLRACATNPQIPADVVYTLRAQRCLALDRRGRYAESEAETRRILAEWPAEAGREGRLIRELINGMAVRLHNQDRPREAEPYYREAESLCIAAVGEAHPDRLLAGLNLASALLDQEKWDEAGRQLDVLMPHCTQALPSDHVYLGLALAWRAWVQMEHGQTSDAVQSARRAVGIFRNTLGENHWACANALGIQGAALVRAQKFADAEPLLVKSARTMLAAADAPRQRRRWVLDQLIGFYEAQGQPDEAAKWRAEKEKAEGK